MSTDDDVARARRAVAEAQRCIAVLETHFGDTVAMRRLTIDVSRLQEDLAQVEKAPATRPSVPVLEIVPDRDYEPGFWIDAEDEGLGKPRF